jgi:RNA polymerase sigma-70 factor (ECF subfamily)
MLGRNAVASAPSAGIEDASQPRATGEVPPFPVVYQKYFAFVWRNARLLGVGPHAIDDVVQEIFIAIHSRLHTLCDPLALRSWIYGVVRRVSMGHARLNRARIESLLVDSGAETDVASGCPTPLDAAERTDRVKLLWQLLDELDASKREAFILVELEEMTMPEIAQALELPLGTVYSRVRAARQAFEAALARHNARTKRGGNP